MQQTQDRIELYRIGLNSDCPVDQISAGGQTFVKKSEKVSGYGGDTKRTDVVGAIVRVPPGQLDKIMESARHKVIRSTTGKRARHKVYDTRCRNYLRQAGDVPAMQFMYWEKVEGQENPFEKVAKPTLSDLAQAQESSKRKKAGSSKL